MKTMPGSKVSHPSSLADGHRRFCSRLEKGLAGTRRCAATSEGFHSACLPELCAIWSPQG